MSTKKLARQNKMIEILRARNAVPVKELAQVFGVSEMTIRRDLDLLEKNGVCENVDGTIVYNPAHALVKSGDGEYSLSVETERQGEEKAAIGRLAASLVQPNDCIILDTGSTTVHIANNLPLDFPMTVLCYNINILMELRRAPNVNILLAGGRYHPNTQMFESTQGRDFINSQRAHKVFISAAGVHPELGITCIENYEVETKRAILHSSLQKILVADSSKFGKMQNCYCCNLADVNAVVTDRGLSYEWQTIIRDLGIALYMA